MSTKTDWLGYCVGLAAVPADLYSGCRKILRDRTLYFADLDGSIVLADAGFTNAKMSYLRRFYLHEESRRVAVDLWARRRVQDKYGSVGVTCYNHFIKGEKTSKRASVLGPCIQSVVITYLDRRTFAVDVFYARTELLKKFLPDLIFLRDEIVAAFDLSGMTCQGVVCHFANVTMHPMYWATILPHLDRPVEAFIVLAQQDRYFHDWCVKWSARYLCDEFHRGIAKFAQALRVQMDVRRRLTPEALADLQAYIRTHHPPLKTHFAEANEALGQVDEEEEDEDDPVE